jgi:hypothetical protein
MGRSITTAPHWHHRAHESWSTKKQNYVKPGPHMPSTDGTWGQLSATTAATAFGSKKPHPSKSLTLSPGCQQKKKCHPLLPLPSPPQPPKTWLKRSSKPPQQPPSPHSTSPSAPRCSNWPTFSPQPPKHPVKRPPHQPSHQVSSRYRLPKFQGWKHPPPPRPRLRHQFQGWNQQPSSPNKPTPMPNTQATPVADDANEPRPAAAPHKRPTRLRLLPQQRSPDPSHAIEGKTATSTSPTTSPTTSPKRHQHQQHRYPQPNATNYQPTLFHRQHRGRSNHWRGARIPPPQTRTR